MFKHWSLLEKDPFQKGSRRLAWLFRLFIFRTQRARVITRPRRVVLGSMYQSTVQVALSPFPSSKEEENTPSSNRKRETKPIPEKQNGPRRRGFFSWFDYGGDILPPFLEDTEWFFLKLTFFERSGSKKKLIKSETRENELTENRWIGYKRNSTHHIDRGARKTELCYEATAGFHFSFLQ